MPTREEVTPPMSYEIVKKEYVDIDTGEILETECSRKKRYATSIGVDYMFFILQEDEDDMLTFSKSEMYVLQRVCKEIPPYGKSNGLIISLNTPSLERWASESKSGYKPRTLKNCFLSLVEKDMFRRISRGVYMINPKYYYKGNLNNIAKARNEYNEIPITSRKKGQDKD